MDTKNQPPAKIPAVRTYAGDLELGRKTKDTTAKEKKPVEEKVAPSKEEELMKEVEKELPLLVSEPPTKNTSLPPATTTPEITKIKKVTSTKTTPIIPRRDTFIAENADSAPATIITDAKHGRFKLMPAIKASIKSWFTSKKDSYHAKKIPKYTISETSKRKEVIQKATSNTGKLATADFSSIHERIRNRNENEKKNNPPTTWSANTEPGFLLLEEPDTSIVTNIQMISRRSFRTVPQEIRVTEINHNRKSKILSPREYTHPAIVETIAPEITPAPVLAVAKNIISAEKIAEKLALMEEIDAQRWHPETVVTTTPTAGIETERVTTKNETSPLPVKLAQTPLPEVQVSQPLAAPRWISETPIETVPVEVPKPVSLPIIKLEQPEPIPKAEVSAKPVPAEPPLTAKTKKKLLSLNTNILTFSVSGLAIAIILFVGLGYFWVAKQIKLDSSQVEAELPLLIDVPLKKIAGVDDSKENLLQALATTGKENNDAIQVVFLSSKPNYAPIPPVNLLSTFDIFLEQNFAQSISDIRFGIAKDKQPFVIIKTAHETAAKGGLLMWENGMYEDLAGILSIEETDPLANTKFVDASLNGIDVRVLKNKNGTERLIYGFTKDTIIITTNIFNFSELAKSVK